MFDKQVYDLTAGDIEEHGVWYFPMDETVQDELTVRPVCSKEVIDIGFQVIVRTRFETCRGDEYIGYIYWSNSSAIGHLQPVMFVSMDECINFWSGVSDPDWGNYSLELQAVRSDFPISFSSESVFDLTSVTGVLQGLYSVKDGQVMVYT
ncbi:hypothetical protein [Pseudomonas frederiksbergensis]|uniref:hypothetical protein n=1 Tax=Pseudomonas frederiksbergensis TaxID=104087 RepID=UPI002DB5F363|nr:hypothetical protein [Pseudomonas frederiksbergensis]WRV69252.1 hypothetical protein VQ575_04125 [Pseudomonas frederiksbergensis]